jgi:hypothetical protein
MRFAMFTLVLAFPALAQLDSSTLHAKFGPPARQGAQPSQGNLGVTWVSSAEYEHVTVVETGHGDTLYATTVRFKTEGCS